MYAQNRGRIMHRIANLNQCMYGRCVRGFPHDPAENTVYLPSLYHYSLFTLLSLFIIIYIYYLIYGLLVSRESICALISTQYKYARAFLFSPI